MNNLVNTLIFFILAVISGVLAYFEDTKWYNFGDRKTKDDCDKLNVDLKKGDPCGIWQTDQCRKGVVIDGNKCESKGSIVPLATITLFLVSITLFLVYLVKYIQNRK